MNKTVTINISGIIFHIEEDAYDSLSRYMQTIKGYFSNTDGGNEIMSDIEARIAELLQGRINATKQVILMSDVEHVTGIMGKPEDFGGESKGEAKKEDESYYQEEKIRRRLYRNPDDKAIGGVCSGLAAYFDIDTVWIRLAMFLLIFFGGISLWVYIILWIIIPLAKTTADKFAMRGESANINTIFQSFKDEADDVKTRFNKYGREFRNNEYNQSVRGNASRVLGAIFNILGRLVGLFLLGVGAIFLFAYLTSLFGFSILHSNTDVTRWKAVIFESSSNYALGIFAFIIVLGIPIFMLIYGGIKLLFRIHYSNRWLNLSLGILWVLGLVLGFYVTVVTVKQFNETSRLKETIELHGMGDTLVIKMNPAALVVKNYNYDNEDDLDTYFGNNHSGFTFGESGKALNVIGYAGLNVVESNTDSVELVIIQSARGGSKKESNASAKAIKYSYRQNGKELIFDEIFTVAQGSQFRAQELDIKLKLPKGKVIYLDKSVRNLLDDVDNTTNTWDGDMVSRRWIMTEKGLKCIDCDDLENVNGTHGHGYDYEDEHGEKVTINKNGIHVKDKNSEIRIDEDGIRIKTPEKNVEVKNEDKEK